MTAAEWQRNLPDLPIVLMSGYSVLEVTQQSAGLGITEFGLVAFLSRRR